MLQTPGVVRAAFVGFGPVGKPVADLRVIGLAYNLAEDFLSEDDAVDCPLWARVDERIVAIFDDGDRLELEFCADSCARMSKNRLPVGIKSGIRNNSDASRLFAPCLGRTLTGLDIAATGSYPPSSPHTA